MDDAELGQLLTEAGVTQVEAILQGREAGVARIAANVEAAAVDGVFGAPSFVVEGQLFFGNDRLSFLEQALPA